MQNDNENKCVEDCFCWKVIEKEDHDKLHIPNTEEDIPIFTSIMIDMQNDDKYKCVATFFCWKEIEKENPDKLHIPKTEDDIPIFTASIIINKLNAFHVPVKIPVYLHIIFDICSIGNLAYIQLLVKELLLHIRNKYGKIPDGYIVKTSDFSSMYGDSFPFLSIPEVNAKYQEMWLAQKQSGTNKNLCDTYEWWQEVMNDIS